MAKPANAPRRLAARSGRQPRGSPFPAADSVAKGSRDRLVRLNTGRCGVDVPNPDRARNSPGARSHA